MKIIHTASVTEAVARLCQEANFNLGQDMLESFKKAFDEDTMFILAIG
ncbi:MAG: hypothetical protein K6T66_14035 [Peptococcaceae bacterium]|nr:hypothetical protein [Peptococcaceae bacterium]